MQSVMKKQLVNELHAPARRNFQRTHVVIKGVHDDLWQADLIDMSNYRDKGYRYILTIIDAGSKVAWAIPMKQKTGLEVSKALRKVLTESKFSPRLLQTDDGLEFKNRYVYQLLKEWNIYRYSTFSPLKASIVERFNRTIKNKIWKHFSLTGKYKWVDDLSGLLKEYNSTIHRSIGMKPIDVRKKHEKEILEKLNKPKFTKKINKFSVGDWVRISKYKSAFDKGYTGNWTNEQFKIEKVHNNYDVPVYSLVDVNGNDLSGLFYQEELKRVQYPGVYLVEKVLKRKENKVYVKWLGFNNTHNSWIDANQI